MSRLLALGLVAASLAGACRKERPAASTGAADAAATPGPARAAAIAHGGVGTPAGESDGCRKAVDAALAVLEAGGDPVDAAVAGVVVMEDDPRYNAGTGSRVRIDGETVQMDASVMRSDGRFGAVAIIEEVKNPVKVARAVMDTPHILLAGDGATRFARALGMPAYDPRTPAMVEKTRGIQAQLRAADPSLPEDWRKFDWAAHWNFEQTIEKAGILPEDVAKDTVGVAVRTADGRFAVALSTGGTPITLKGRIGDVPILGAGLFASPAGAVAATGTGERMVEVGFAREVVGWLAAGKPAQAAADESVEWMRAKTSVGVIVITPTTMGAAADRPMAWAAREAGSSEWLGPVPAKASP